MIKPPELDADERGRRLWELLTASANGDLAATRRLLQADPALATAEFEYTQPLYLAVREGHQAITQELLAAGADPSFMRYGGENLVVVARDRGHDQLADVLLRAQELVAGSTLEDHELHGAVGEGRLGDVAALLDRDASLVNQKDSAGRAPLHLAVEKGSTSMAKLLIERGADVEALCGSNDRFGGADRFKPIDLAIWRGSFWICTRADWPMVEFLLAQGAEYSITTAAARGDEQKVQELLAQNRGQANNAQPCGRGPLSSAIEFSHLKIAALLLDHGADPALAEGRFAPHGTSLYWAAKRNLRDLIQRLLEAGADPSGTIDSCEPILGLVSDKATRLLLYEHGATMDAFCYVLEENVDAVAAMAAVDPQVVARSGCGGPLAAAVLSENWGMLRMLLNKGVRVPESVTGCRTYLWRVPAMTRVLLEHGMDPNLPDWQRATPLHAICDRDGRGRPDANRHELLDLFLEFGADLNAVDDDYRSTPLGWAARHGLEDMVSLLLSKGADPNLPAAPGWATPLAWANRRNHQHITHVLQAHGAQ